jgi:hypothetical protein
VDVGTGEGVGVAEGIREAVGGLGVKGVGGFDGEQAYSPAKNVSNIPVCFIA